MLRRIVQCASLTAVIGGLGVIGAGCLDRPVVTAEPLIKTTVTLGVAENGVDQVDILFDIDNSASMGDKQALLELAVPDLVGRLLNPNCLAADGVTVLGISVAGDCTAAGGTPEFKAVHDMHLGIVSSSLGFRGGDLCDPGQMTNQVAMGNPQVYVPTPFKDGQPSINSHADDQGHLIAREAVTPNPLEDETPAPTTMVGTQNFLDYFPMATPDDPSATVGTQALTPPPTPETSAMQLETDFGNLVVGVHAYGCGIESQMESWYRFLIQPDPYASIAPAGSANSGAWVGYDQTIIAQRHDFLRPKSLVAIIVLTDENDSEIDTRSYGGIAANWMLNGNNTLDLDGGTTNAFHPPRGTSPCNLTPDSPDCVSCDSTNAPAGDTNCALPANTSVVDWGNDVNLRHVHMKQKYGLVPQYPIQRYYLGLTSPTVPDRTMEYPPGAQTYQGGTAQPDATGAYQLGNQAQLNCTNPLFAPPNGDGSTSLPDGTDMTPATLCNTAHPYSQVLSRSISGLVFFAHIGGVPHQLLQAAPGVDMDAAGNVICSATTPPADCPQKDQLLPADWISILGQVDGTATPGSTPSYNPTAYAGIDQHMVESYQPRTGLMAANAQALGGGPDPINGREWVTDTSTTAADGTLSAVHVNLAVDREYACIFPLVNPMTGAATPRDCSGYSATPAVNDYVNEESCDCSTPGLSATGPSPIPALCGQCTTAGCIDNPTSTDYNLQYYAKAYPTIREIELVHLMGNQGVLSSLCPIHPAYAGGDTTDPVFGYRPAVTSIINRLKTALSAACLPEKLSPTAGQCPGDTNTMDQCVPCLILETLSPTDPNPTCAAHMFTDPSAEVKANFLKTQGDAAVGLTICEVPQIPYNGQSCAASNTPGWCYVDGTAAGQGCKVAGTPQSIVFSASGLAHGANASLQCLESSDAGNN